MGDTCVLTRAGSDGTAGHRLRAIEQPESRALIKPKKTVEQVNPNAELDRKLDAMSLDELRQLAARRPAEVQLAPREARPGCCKRGGRRSGSDSADSACACHQASGWAGCPSPHPASRTTRTEDVIAPADTPPVVNGGNEHRCGWG
jgi:hypothetical protein